MLIARGRYFWQTRKWRNGKEDFLRLARGVLELRLEYSEECNSQEDAEHIDAAPFLPPRRQGRQEILKLGALGVLAVVQYHPDNYNIFCNTQEKPSGHRAVTGRGHHTNCTVS